MRSCSLALAAFIAASLSLTACQCENKLTQLAPELVVIKPTEKDGELWVIDFGTIRVGRELTREIVIENHGNVFSGISSQKLRDGSDVGFTLGGDRVPFDVSPSSAFKAIVQYRPTARGVSTGFVDITTTDPRLPKVTVKLTAKAEAGTAEVCAETLTVGTFDCATVDHPLTIEYGAHLLNSASVSRKVRIRNTGDTSIAYAGTSFTESTPLSFTMSPDQNNAAAELAPAAVREFSIDFAPVVADTFIGIAQVVTDDPVLPLVNINLRGAAATSLTCTLVVTPTSVAYGQVPTGSSQDAVISVFNSGVLPCNISSMKTTGNPAFGVVSGSVTVLAPRASTEVKVRYQPSGEQNDTASFEVDSDDPARAHIVVPLSGSGVEPPDCVLSANPTSLEFGGVEVGDRVIRSVSLTAPAGGFCTVKSVTLATPNANFVLQPPALGLVSPLGGSSAGLTYAPKAASPNDNNMLIVKYQAGFLSGPTLSLNIPISAKSGVKKLCIEPARLHFGAVGVGSSKTLPFTMRACAGSSVTVQSISMTQAGPFTLSPAPVPNQVIPNGMIAMQSVVATPTTAANVAGTVEVVSDDPIFTKQLVPVDMGPETVSADAGEVMYTWEAAAITTTQEGTVMKTNLQGPPNRSAFYGTKTMKGQNCSGCHAVSPDGKYAALIEYGTPPTMRIVDTRTGGTVPVANTMSGQFPSWNPNPNTNPPYQFVYNDGNVLKTASMITGVIGVLQGANEPSKIQTQPSWGPNGKIVFVRGTAGLDGGEFGIAGPADLVIIPESGGVATPVPGASGTPAENYMPEFSPNGKYIAFTYSASGQGTRSAKDSVVRLVEVATGDIKLLPQLNAAGPNSWPTWSKDGKLLSFSSTRSGGEGSADIYYAPVDQDTGVDQPAVNMSNVNTNQYDHISRWSFLPPP